MKIPWLEAFLVVGVALFTGGLAEGREYQDPAPGFIGFGAGCLMAGGLAYDARRRAQLVPPHCSECARRDMADIRAAMEAQRKARAAAPATDAIRQR